MPSAQTNVPFDVLAPLSSDGLILLASDGAVLAWSDAATAITTIDARTAVGANIASLVANSEALLEAAAFPATAMIAPLHRAELQIRAVIAATHEGFLLSFGPQRHFAQIEQLKNELLATISHELKTPLATIKAFATTLRENPMHEALDRDEYLATIDRQADRLARAIDGMLRAARVDADQLPSRRDCVALDRVLENALTELGPEVGAHPIERKTLGVDVCGDPDLLQEIFVHVLRNALMYSREGAPIEVRGLTLSEVSIISIRDRGIGIEAEHLPYVFERFYRAEPKMTASTSGAGLGLFIVRALVRAHGGSITIESTPGSGTLVTITLPVRT